MFALLAVTSLLLAACGGRDTTQPATTQVTTTKQKVRTVSEVLYRRM